MFGKAVTVREPASRVERLIVRVARPARHEVRHTGAGLQSHQPQEAAPIRSGLASPAARSALRLVGRPERDLRSLAVEPLGHAARKPRQMIARIGPMAGRTPVHAVKDEVVGPFRKRGSGEPAVEHQVTRDCRALNPVIASRAVQVNLPGTVEARHKAFRIEARQAQRAGRTCRHASAASGADGLVQLDSALGNS